ncbi:MAG TPA: hypothetical protein VEA63_04905, partial [Opitutus sp.]|nr:hypothetical protein [Opitutus sp.]
MTNSLTKLLKAGPPPPQVVLLPDEVFFTRAIAVPAGATAIETASLVELALETLSPFPPAQLYHGYYWPSGAERALVFATYRRRFTVEQTAEWQVAELVLPAFATLLGGDVQAHTTLIVPSPEGVTAIYWDDQPVPARVTYRPVPPDSAETEAAKVREELLAVMPRNHAYVLKAAPVADSSGSDSEIVFRSDDFVSQLPKTRTAAMDVRDKEALTALRRAQSRDVLLWRTFLGFAAILLLLALGELALIGASFWQHTRVARANQ